MEQLNLLNKILKEASTCNVELKSIPILREKLYFKCFTNSRFKWFLSLLVGYFILFHCIGFRVLTNQCSITFPDSLAKIFRPPIDCGFCRDVKNFDVRDELTPDDFEINYAYSARPVKVIDGAINWTAVDVFDYWYFKDIYDDFLASNEEFDCQFFPYKSGFKEIFDAFSMSHNRINQKGNEKPWYFGWSNCNNEIAQEFRKHYSKPYFLPKISENNPIDWIFIGVPGMGAHLHVDNVRLPSWQAQLKGSKKWEIAPPPECYFQCQSFEMVVNPGEIIVLDTNKWYHKTNVLPGEISVTIGAEYD